MAALVAAALSQIGERPAWLAASLSDRYRTPATIMCAAALALTLTTGVAVFAGVALAPLLTPEARLLLLALALIIQGGGALFPVKPPERLAQLKLGVFPGAAIGFVILLSGHGIQFIVATLAARSTLPPLAAVGAVVGSLPVLTSAALSGEQYWQALPLRRVRIFIGILFIVFGIITALRATALI